MRLFSDWRFQATAGGALLEDPRGPRHGWVRIARGERPLSGIGALVARVADELGAALVEVGAPERLTTVEGEYAALARLAARVDGQPVERVVAAVFGDESFTRVDAMLPGGALAGEVRELVRVTRLGLGAVRRRRFLYAPPPWTSVVRAGVAEHHHPQHPARLGRILVFPAQPIGVPADPIDASRLSLAGLRSWGGRPVVTDHGLRGDVMHIVDGARRVDVVALGDDRYRYVAHLEADPTGYAALVEDFVALVRTIEPLPRPELAVRAADVFSEWS